VVTRGEIYWTDLDSSAERRPVCVLTRTNAASVLNGIVCAPITRTIRAIRSEVSVGPVQGLPEGSVITCDTILTVPKGRLAESPATTVELDRALRFALDIRW
jgi:mRNA interferase MazF